MTIPLLDVASVSEARLRVRALGAEAGLPVAELERCAAAVSELAHNALRHARGGELEVRIVHRDGTSGLEARVFDRGDGIADPARAFVGRPVGSSGEGLGIGLAAAHRLCHELDLDVRIGEGTTSIARRFAERPPRLPEVGLFGAPHPDGPPSGDDAGVWRLDDGVVIAVADGLGHGPDAREGARALLAPVGGLLDAPLDAILSASGAAARGTRGGALTVVRWRRSGVEVAGVGNVSARIVAGGTMRSVPATPGALTGRRRSGGARVHHHPATPGMRLLVHTDGLKARDLALETLHGTVHPAAAASVLVQRHARRTDDVLVAVAW